MRLLKTRDLELCEFMADPPRYAILSHTWGEQEVSYQEMITNPRSDDVKRKPGFAKIENFCKIALAQGYDFAWVDTCCINKTDPTELTEAINSMYKWYKESDVCISYMCDVTSARDCLSSNSTEFESSRWFGRGWTLQELLAPAKVNFYSAGWLFITSKAVQSQRLSEITGIDKHVLLQESEIDHYSISTRMSWARHRRTTRLEDMAYCMLGIFNVNMPLLYGEGSKAFTRLQEEIVKISDDQSIFAWDATLVDSALPPGWCSIYAPSPKLFRPDVERLHRDFYSDHFAYAYKPYISTNLGVQISLPIAHTRNNDRASRHFYAILDCHISDDPICIPLEPVTADETRYRRGKGCNTTSQCLKDMICSTREVYLHSQSTWQWIRMPASSRSNGDRWSTRSLERRRTLRYMLAERVVELPASAATVKELTLLYVILWTLFTVGSWLSGISLNKVWINFVMIGTEVSLGPVGFQALYDSALILLLGLKMFCKKVSTNPLRMSFIELPPLLVAWSRDSMKSTFRLRRSDTVQRYSSSQEHLVSLFVGEAFIILSLTLLFMRIALYFASE